MAREANKKNTKGIKGYENSLLEPSTIHPSYLPVLHSLVYNPKRQEGCIKCYMQIGLVFVCKQGFNVVIADVLNDSPHALHIRSDFAFIHPVADDVAQNTAEVFKTRIRGKAAAVR